VNALANPEVGRYLNEYFVSSFQKVATFRIVAAGQKQGGNVASYFCAPDGRVLHVVAGPVDSATLLREAKWVVATTRLAMAESKEDGAAFKAYIRKAHAERLRREHGLIVEPVTFDPPMVQDENSALTYRDPSGRPLAPRLPPAPVDGPDVTFRLAQETAARSLGAAPVADKKGRRWVLGNQGRVHMLLAAHGLAKIEKVYGSVFEGILGEKVTTKPIEVLTPFPWVRERAGS
jgi:hypothetical protein